MHNISGQGFTKVLILHKAFNRYVSFGNSRQNLSLLLDGLSQFHACSFVLPDVESFFVLELGSHVTKYFFINISAPQIAIEPFQHYFHIDILKFNQAEGQLGVAKIQEEHVASKSGLGFFETSIVHTNSN